MEAIKNWKEEKRSVYLYRALATVEPNPVHKKLFLELANAADKQAEIWAKAAKEANVVLPSSYLPDLRARMVVFLLRWLGPQSLRLILSAMKVRGMSVYQGMASEAGLPEPVERLEHRHRGLKSANNLRAAVFGINDGLISNASLMFGVAGATTNVSVLILTGVAGLLAGACSMGAGEYVSVRSQREMLEYQLALEKSELELYPEEEAEELSLIYQARGIPKNDADALAKKLISNPEKALDTLAREELGINPQEMLSPTGAGVASFIAFSIGAFVPLIPYVFAFSNALSISIALTGIVLFAVGATLSLFTQRSALWGGLRMLLIGAAAGLLTHLIGTWLGV